MAAMKKHSTALTVQALIEFDEIELRALDAIMGYGAESFVKVFYEHMGKSYLKPNEGGVHSLFKTLGPPVAEALQKIDAARQVLDPKTKQ